MKASEEDQPLLVACEHCPQPVQLLSRVRVEADPERAGRLRVHVANRAELELALRAHRVQHRGQQ